MSVLVVDLEVVPGGERRLEEAFVSRFRPAITAQSGFERVELLRPVGGGHWLLLIGFRDEESRLAWVATDLHQEVWPRLESCCRRAEPTVYEPAG